MSRNSTAAKVREDKENHPGRYCPNRSCLWRVMSPHSAEIKPCPKHQAHLIPAFTPREAS